MKHVPKQECHPQRYSQEAEQSPWSQKSLTSWPDWPSLFSDKGERRRVQHWHQGGTPLSVVWTLPGAVGGAECSLECWSSQPPFPSQAAFYLLLFVASDKWVKMLNYLAAVVKWILKQLASAKNGQLALSLGFCQRKCLFSVCLPAVCASCCCGHIWPWSTFVSQRVPDAWTSAQLAWVGAWNTLVLLFFCFSSVAIVVLGTLHHPPAAAGFHHPTSVLGTQCRSC